jgi:hypothetical protein
MRTPLDRKVVFGLFAAAVLLAPVMASAQNGVGVHSSAK